MSEGTTAERSRGALFLLVAIFAAAALWFVLGSAESVAPVVRGAGRHSAADVVSAAGRSCLDPAG